MVSSPEDDTYPSVARKPARSRLVSAGASDAEVADAGQNLDAGRRPFGVTK